MADRFDERDRDRERPGRWDIERREWDRGFGNERWGERGRGDWERERREGRFGEGRFGEGRFGEGRYEEPGREYRGREDWGRDIYGYGRERREDWRREEPYEGRERFSDYGERGDWGRQGTWGTFGNRPSWERERPYRETREWDRSREERGERERGEHRGERDYRGFGTEAIYPGGSGAYGGGMGVYTQRGGYVGRGPKGWQRSDERIREDVNERLTDHPHVDASEIDVQVKNAEVTLTGTVDDRHMKRLAEDVAENVSGVKEVHNQLRVQPQGAERQGTTTTSSTTRR